MSAFPPKLQAIRKWAWWGDTESTTTWTGYLRHSSCEQPLWPQGLGWRWTSTGKWFGCQTTTLCKLLSPDGGLELFQQTMESHASRKRSPKNGEDSGFLKILELGMLRPWLKFMLIDKLDYIFHTWIYNIYYFIIIIRQRWADVADSTCSRTCCSMWVRQRWHFSQ